MVATSRTPEVFHFRGLGEPTLVQSFRNLSDSLKDASFLPLVFDGNHTEGAVEGLLSTALKSIEGLRELDDSLIELVHFYRNLSARNQRHSNQALGKYRLEILSNILAAISRRRPLAIFAVNLDGGQPSDLEALAHIAEFVFGDPLRDLAPEASTTGVYGFLAYVDSAHAPSWAKELDASEDRKGEALEILSSPGNLQKLLAAVRGDIAKIPDLIDDLETHSTSFAQHRLKNLPEDEQAFVHLLALAARPLGLDRIERSMEALGTRVHLKDVLRSLQEAGWIERRISNGSIEVYLSDSQLKSAFANAASNQHYRTALANAEITCGGSSFDPVFVTEQFYLADEFDLASKFGLRALEQLRNRGAWEECVQLAEKLETQEVHGVLDVKLEALRMLGRHREALICALALEESSGESVDLSLEVAALSTRLGDFDEAVRRYRSVQESSKSGQHVLKAQNGLADIAYARGEHKDAEAISEKVISEILAGERGFSEDLILVQARNTLGKLSIFQAKYTKSREIFEANLDLAHSYGWEDEEARALANLGVVALQERDHAQATQLLNQALKLSATQSSLPRAYCHVNLATIAQREQRFEKAVEHCLEGMRAARIAQDSTAYGVGAHNLATIYQDLGLYGRAHEVIDHLETNPADTIANRWNQRVRAYLLLESGENERALELFKSLEGKDFHTALYGPESHLRIAQIHLEASRYETCEEVLQEFDIDENNGDFELLMALHSMLTSELALRRDGAFDMDALKETTETLVRLNQPYDALRAAIVFAKGMIKEGEGDVALKTLQSQLKRVGAVAEKLPDLYRKSYVEKPLHVELLDLIRTLQGEVPQVLRPIETQAKASAERSATWSPAFDDIIGQDPHLYQMFRVIEKVAPSNATVLLFGESGTGKELLAEAIHAKSKRAEKPLVKVNCAAFVESLLLSELFGHEKGAYTGATHQKPGRFELADGGTLFLDEIGDISPNTQVALLRVLQEGTFERVGGHETIKTDVRVICATNKDLEELVRKGEFRLDLYYRLKGVIIESPSLRERRADIPSLVLHFAEMFSEDVTPRFEKPVLEFLSKYSWPGNIRELQNFVKSVLLFAESDVVSLSTLEDFKDFFQSGDFVDSIEFEIAEAKERARASVVALPKIGESSDRDIESMLVEKVVREGLSLTDLKHRLEIESIKRALMEAEGNVTRAAEILQMKRPRLSQIINGTEELADLKSTLVG